MYCIGPGRYNAFIAIKSSKTVGSNSLRYFCIPGDSNWKVQMVLPSQYNWKVAGSSIGIWSTSSSIPRLSSILATASLRIESVLRPKKSILINPVSSITLPSYCVQSNFSFVSLSSAVETGTQSEIASRQIMTPHA